MFDPIPSMKAMQVTALDEVARRKAVPKKLPMLISHDTWMSLSLQQQAEQREKYDVVVEPAYAQADEVAEVAKEGK